MNLRELNERIIKLEEKREAEWKELSAELQTFYESIQPSNLLKSTLASTAKSPALKSTLLTKLTDLVTAYLTKKISGENASPTKKALVNLSEYLITEMVAKKSDDIIALGENLFRYVVARKRKRDTT